MALREPNTQHPAPGSVESWPQAWDSCPPLGVMETILEAQQRAGTPAAPFPGKPGSHRGLSWAASPTSLTRDPATHRHLNCHSVGLRARGLGLVLPSRRTMRAVPQPPPTWSSSLPLPEGTQHSGTDGAEPWPLSVP